MSDRVYNECLKELVAKSKIEVSVCDLCEYDPSMRRKIGCHLNSAGDCVNVKVTRV